MHNLPRILANEFTVSNDTRETQLNNNDLIIGPPGSGKTRNYVKPNLLQMNESMIITDVKGLLVHEIAPVLTHHGYNVMHIDFTDLEHSPCGYNPLSAIRIDEYGSFNEQDVLKLASIISPNGNGDNMFWENLARLYIAMLIGFMLESLPEHEQNPCTLSKLLTDVNTNDFKQWIDQTEFVNPSSFAARKYRLLETIEASERTIGSIMAHCAEKLDPLSFAGTEHLYTADEQLDFKALADSKSALFLTTSDTDHSLDKLVTMLYSQALDVLCTYANEFPSHALPTPVRFYLDDFASSCQIPDFDKTITSIRSRNISASIMLQSITQLSSLYGPSAAYTITNACDHILYLGGHDITTATIISKLANTRIEKVLQLKPGDAYLVESGKPAKLVSTYELENHDLYFDLPEVKAWVDEIEHDLQGENHAELYTDLA